MEDIFWFALIKEIDFQVLDRKIDIWNDGKGVELSWFVIVMTNGFPFVRRKEFVFSFNGDFDNGFGNIMEMVSECAEVIAHFNDVLDIGFKILTQVHLKFMKGWVNADMDKEGKKEQACKGQKFDVFCLFQDKNGQA